MVMDKNMMLNDFGIVISTINGSGSTTANNTILQAIFKMGIPVSARNIFPSNIQGMPTWYFLRVSDKGYMGRLEKNDILIEMNPSTLNENLKNLKPGSVILINKNISLADIDGDFMIYQLPVDEVLNESDVPSNLSVYLANMVYVGVLSWLIGIDLNQLEIALDQHFRGKRSAVDLNFRVVRDSFEWGKENLKKMDPYKLDGGESFTDRIMMDGNTASALGALYGGLQFAAWYPITPASSLSESVNEYVAKLRTDPETGIATCAVVQAEDELAAVGMAVGAGWAGLRSMTATSGPGLSLMAEFIGLAYFAEIPLVIWDIQRVGPSTGLPTHTSQGDLSFSYFISHGDKDLIILLPANINECFNFGWKALDIAEQLQTPVLVLSDLEIGMNLWMGEDFTYPDKELSRGKILWEDELEKIVTENKEKWGRYKDIDNDGIPYRTVPGNLHPQSAYFTRGTGHDPFAHYSEDAKDWEENLLRLKQKVRKAESLLPSPVEAIKNGGEYGIISYGSSHFPVIEAVENLNHDGKSYDYLRLRGIPFNKIVREFLNTHESVFVVENNRDGQMAQVLSVEFPEYAYKLKKIAKCDGLSLSSEWIKKEIEECNDLGTN